MKAKEQKIGQKKSGAKTSLFKIREIESAAMAANDLIGSLKAARRQKTYLSLESIAGILRGVLGKHEIIALIGELTKNYDKKLR